MRICAGVRVGLAISCFLLVSRADSRVLSYSPVTQKFAYPAIQFRAAPDFVLIEADPVPPPLYVHHDRLVVHSADPRIDPRVVLGDDSPRSLWFAAAWEDSAGTLRLLVLATSNPGHGIPDPGARFLYSPDGGAHWIETSLPSAGLPVFFGETDFGGPVVRGFRQIVRLGNGENPFIVSIPGMAAAPAVYAIAADGSTRKIFDGSANLLGTSSDGALLLIEPLSDAATLPVLVRDMRSGETSFVANVPRRSVLEGWITPDRGVYLLDLTLGSSSLSLFSPLTSGVVYSALPVTKAGEFFAIPTADFRGAWILQRGRGIPTTLSRHTPESGLVTQWNDASKPPVEALHAAASGTRLLLQVERDHQGSGQLLLARKDPALAIWNVGDAPPPEYHELFLAQGSLAGFVHLDVDAAASGDGFVYCSGSPLLTGYGVAPSGGAGGGGDIAGEFGTVRSSFKQRLIVPVAARISGKNGSVWRTDLLIRNPSSQGTVVTLNFSSADEYRTRRVSLARGEVVRIDDVVGSLGIDSGTGALFLDSDGDDGIEAVGYLYTTTANGRFGTQAPAMDANTASGTRFPGTFAAASPASGSRSNIVSTNAIGRSSSGELVLPAGVRFPFTAPPSGQAVLPLEGGPSPAVVETLSGQLTSAALTVDDTTNDPTLFLPDLVPTSQGRALPAVIHGNGSGGAAWLTDLYLFNPSDTSSTIALTAIPWAQPAVGFVQYLQLGPGETRIIPDGLRTLFALDGIASLICQSARTRVTARIRTPAPGGGTMGLAMPPLNSFQIAAPGEALEILVPLGSSRRINLAFTDLGGLDPQPPVERGRPPEPPPRSVTVTVDDGTGPFSPFTVEVPQGGGIQVTDFLAAHPVRADAAGVLIRVSPSAGHIAAFVTRVEPGTNDPAYFPAILAAR